MQLTTTLQKHIFSSLHSRKLIYNTCWEDPRCDRQLLDIKEDSKVLMITSAGCNALDYLLDNPAEIHCVDINYRQNALLLLKKSIFEKQDYKLLFSLFGEGVYNDFERLINSLSGDLPEYVTDYWKQHIHYFKSSGLRKTFYYHGASGILAWFVRQYLAMQPSSHKIFRQLFELTSLEEQQKLFSQVLPEFWNKFMQWISGRQATMFLMGVPKAQRDLILKQYPGGTNAYLTDCLHKVFMNLPLQDNYFYYLYIHGKYSQKCSPNYLKENNFGQLCKNMDNLQVHTHSISSFLQENPGKYSHYILLDHQDWLANHNVAALEEEWRLILENSAAGTKILMRSAAKEIEFFPDFVKESLVFDKEKTRVQHQKDRVGTYASVYLATVK
jgi:S-adenosylmethionine-diacylglycerol 3-amino-3-carboxypropyl transferase